MTIANMIGLGLSCLSFLGMLIVGLITFGAKRELNRVDEVNDKVEEIKYNYLDRFDEIKGMIGDVKTDIAVIKQKLEIK